MSVAVDQGKAPSAGPAPAPANVLTLRIPHPERVFNSVYLPYLNSNIPTQIFFGSARSGKSAFCAQRRVLRMMCEGRNFLCVRNVANTLRDSTYAETVRALERLKVRPYFVTQESRLEMTCLRNGAQQFCRGLDEPSKLQSIVPRSGVITDIDIEEAMEVSEDAANQLHVRLGGESNVPKVTTIRFNPTNRRHWIYRRYFEGFFGDTDKCSRTDDLLILRTTHRDNHFLAEQDHVRLEALGSISPYYDAVFNHGMWGVVEGAIFTKWRTEDLSGRTFENLRYGLDFGYGPDPAVLIETARAGGSIYVTRELGGHGLTNQALAEYIKPVVGEAPVVCDCAEPKSIAELQVCGINAVAVIKRRGMAYGERSSVLFGVQWLQQHEIVVDVKCQGLVNELGLYQWRTSPGGQQMSVPVDRDNHRIDALRYAWEDEMLPHAAPGAFSVKG